MGYIGNQTSNSYSSFDKQDLTGVTGSPAKRGFTLSHAVANAQEIEVFVNNVRQEPGEAYTVSGTGLTMTGDVETTDDFYVVFQGKALQTTVPPDGSVTAAKLDTGAAASNLGTSVNLATIKDSGGTNTAMTIDSSGRVTQPTKPIFYATADSLIGLTTSYAEITAFSNAHVNVGSHYNTSTGRFTAPVAGVYNFGIASIGNAVDTVYRFRPYKNGSSLSNFELRVQTEGGSYGTNGEFSWVVSLSASDYISIFAKSDDGTDAYSDSNFRYTYFRGHLMG